MAGQCAATTASKKEGKKKKKRGKKALSGLDLGSVKKRIRLTCLALNQGRNTNLDYC